METLILREQYPSLYNIARHKLDIVAEVFSTSQAICFRDSLSLRFTRHTFLVHPILKCVVINCLLVSIHHERLAWVIRLAFLYNISGSMLMRHG
jgi:hypothetical protein